MKKLILSVGLMCLAAPLFAASFSSVHPADIASFIATHNPLIYLTLFFGLGVLLAFTPCVLPMVPILSGIITGHRTQSRGRALQLSLGYVLGMASTYAVAGMFAAYFGSTVQTLMQQPIIIASFSTLFVLMALWLLGIFELHFPAFLQSLTPKIHQGKRGVVSATMMGALSTLVVSPCVTAPLIGILTYVGQSGHVLQGGLLLFVLALGMGLPLLLVGAGLGSILPRSGPWMVKIKQLFAILMLAMAIWLLGRIFPDSWLALLWSGFFICAAFLLTMWRDTTQGLSRHGLQILTIAVLMSAGAFAYKNVAPQTTAAGSSSSLFVMVHSLDEVYAELAKAKQNKQGVFIEFFANWCSDCQVMEKKVFNQPEVIAAMYGAVNLRVDISEKNETVTAIRKAFGIYGIPTIAFYNASGQQLDELTSVGQIDKKQMLDLLNQFHNAEHSKSGI